MTPLHTNTQPRQSCALRYRLVPAHALPPLCLIEWLADQTLARRQAAALERRFPLDPPSPADQQRRSRAVEPSAAFGPMGSTGEENVSIVVAPIYAGFALSQLGSPAEAAERLLLPTVAPPGSGRQAALLAAASRTDASGQLYYELEFGVMSERFAPRHNLTVYTARDNVLYTWTAQCPAAQWDKADGPRLRAAAASFRLIPTSAARAGFPTKL